MFVIHEAPDVVRVNACDVDKHSISALMASGSRIVLMLTMQDVQPGGTPCGYIVLNRFLGWYLIADTVILTDAQGRQHVLKSRS